MKEFLGKIFKGDYILWSTIIFLLVFSCVVMFSAISTSTYRYEDHLKPFREHFFYVLIALGIVFITHQFPYKSIRPLVWCIPFGALALLIATMFNGNDVNGAKRSIEIAGIEIQSIEICKLAIIIVLAEVLGYCHKKNKKIGLKTFCILSGIICVFCGLILLQNFSTACMIFMVSIMMMFMAQVSYKYIFSLIGIIVVSCGLFIGVSYTFDIKNGITRRVETWVERVNRYSESKDENTPQKIVIDNNNRQIIDSKVAIANGISPCGPGNSIQRDYLALAYSDFVFAVIIEEYSIVMGMFIILMYIVILGRAGKIARRCKPEDATESILVIGIALIIVIQAFINMAVATELIPVTGQTLPFISRGGMSLMVTAVSLGLILGISAHNNERILKEQAQLAEKANKEVEETEKA
jgi:cell division protein FtsW